MPATKKTKKVPPAKYLLVFDPGEKGGVAFYEDGKLYKHSAVNGASFWDLSEAVDSVLSPNVAYGTPKDTLCIIEDGFGRGIGAKTLDRRRGLCMAAAEHAGFGIIRFVYSSTWQNQLFGSIKGKDTKKLSTEHTGIEDHNVADAVCMGEWAVKFLFST